MNFPNWSFWLHLARTAAIDVCCVAALAFTAHRLIRPANWKRMVWQITVICLLLLPPSEWTGFGQATAQFFFRQNHPSSNTPAARLLTIDPQPSRPPLQQKLNLPPSVPQRPIWWPGWVWICGIIVVLGRMATAQALLLILRLRREKITNQSLQERVLCVAKSVGLRRKVSLFRMPEVISPMAFGVFRPSIGLPPSFETKFSTPEQHAILAHELAHLAANDPLWFRLADFASALLWWHPLAWYVRHMLHSTSELAADEATALVPDGADALAKCLVTLGKEMAASHGWGWAGINGGLRSTLARRVNRLIQISAGPTPSLESWKTAIAKTVTTVLVLPLVVLLFGSFQSAQGQKESSWRDQLHDSWNASPGGIFVLAGLNSDEKQKEDVAARMNNAKLLFQAGKLDEAQAIFLQILKDEPSNLIAKAYLNLIKALRHGELQAEGLEAAPTARITDTNLVFTTSGRENIISKLNSIRVGEANYDLPLTDVLTRLRSESQKRDSNGIGINFMINPGGRAVDMSAVRIKLDSTLKNLRMIDLLKAISKAASQPIGFTIEDYAVVFTPKRPEDMTLYSKVFKVDSDTVVQCLQQFYRIIPEDTNKSFNSAEMIKDYFSRVGVSFNDSDKSVFFNERAGLILARATASDLKIIEKAVSILNEKSEQVVVTARVAVVNTALLTKIMPDWTNWPDDVTRVITEKERQTAIAAIENEDDVLQFPTGSTSSGRRLRLGSEDLTLESLNEVRPDGFSINSTATLTTKTGSQTRTSNIYAFRDVPDGGTLEALITARPPETRRFWIVFITPRIVDPTGKPLHSDAELSRH